MHFWRKRKLRRLLIFILSVLFGLAAVFCIPARSTPATPEQLVRSAQENYRLGKFEQAATLWQQAADSYQIEGDRAKMADNLINKSQALQNLGLYPKACTTLIQVFSTDNLDCSSPSLNRVWLDLAGKKESLSVSQGIGLRSLGDVLRKRGLLKQSSQFLQLSQTALQESPQEAGMTLLSLANTHRAIGNQTIENWSDREITEIIDRASQQNALQPYRKALDTYQQVVKLSSASPITRLQAQVNRYNLIVDINRWWSKESNRRIVSLLGQDGTKSIDGTTDFISQLSSLFVEEIERMEKEILLKFADLKPSHPVIYARLNFAQTQMERGLIKDAESILTETVKQAIAIEDKQGENYALGYLGNVYLQQNNLAKAKQYTQQALLQAQDESIYGDAKEKAYLWQSQLGNILKQQKDTKGAIIAYVAAFNTLDSLRTDLNTSDREVQFDFIEQVKPVYQSLADLLLQSNYSPEELKKWAILNPSFPLKQSSQIIPSDRLSLALRVIESEQLAELDNFFNDPCSQEADMNLQIGDLDTHAAAIYPIILPERLEIVLALPNQPLRQVTFPVSQDQVNLILDELYDHLDNLSADNSAANILLTSNPDPEELKSNLATLLPILHQLNDWFIQPFEQDLQDRQIKTLVFVLKDRLQRVPMAALYDGRQYLVEKYGIALAPSLQLIETKTTKNEDLKILAAGVTQATEAKGETFPALLNVTSELEQIERIFPDTQKLIDREFTPQAIQKQIRSGFSVIHLATHGLFSSNPQKNFLVAGDGTTIDIDRLSSLLKNTDTIPPELLVLSACETATGDERAVLGLAGIAVRSGASSTLATLWSVGDASTARLMAQFYQHLKQPKINKSDAIRNAQLSLIDFLKINPPFQEMKNLPPHPYFWASYVLVGNWL